MIRAVRDEDLKEINEWCIAQREKPFAKKAIPNIGRIEPGVACGFIFQTDSSLCLIEGYVTNPKASSEARNKALFAITVQLMTEAKDMGFTTVLAITKDLSIMERALMHGFKDLGFYHLFSKEI